MSLRRLANTVQHLRIHLNHKSKSLIKEAACTSQSQRPVTLASQCINSFNHVSSVRLVSSKSSRKFHSQNALVNGVNIHYERVGTGKQVVLLLPGALGCSRTDFLPQLENLSAEKYTIIAFDPRGYGKSRPPDRDWPLMFLQRDAEDAAELMKVIDEPIYSVLGWSDGGITGMILAAARPENVHKLVIWGANAYITENDMKAVRGLENIDSWSDRMKKPFIEIYGENYFRTQWKAWVDAYDNYYKNNNGDICKNDLAKIKCDTLLVNGHLDALVPQEHPNYLATNIENCLMIDWPQGKHNLHLRYATEFNKLVEKFLDET